MSLRKKEDAPSPALARNALPQLPGVSSKASWFGSAIKQFAKLDVSRGTHLVAISSASYKVVQQAESDKQLEQQENQFDRLSSEGWPRGDRQRDSRTRMRDLYRARRKAVDYWVNQDFTETRVPTAEELFQNYEERFKDTAASSGSGNRYPTFSSAWAVFDDPKEVTENLKAQDTVIENAYKSYVAARKTASIVEEWTREADGTGIAPPHQIMEDLLLKKAGLFRQADLNLNIEGYNRGETEQSIHRLYTLVTQAPRCPDMMSFVRTIRHDTRLPSEWFKRIHNRKMTEGDSVILPVFMSTSNLSFGTSWLAHGHDSVAAEFDTNPKTENCCFIQVILPKGIPMLPLGDFESNEHQHENEILIPPGVELVYSGNDIYEDSDDDFTSVHTYIARIGPPDLLTRA